MPASNAEDDARWLEAAARLAARGRRTSRPNPAVGAIIVSDGRVVGRGWTQAGGRPHAEAVALAEAGAHADNATLYVTLEPCAHVSPRGPSCAATIAASGLARVVVGCLDPDERTAGAGLDAIRAADKAADLLPTPACEASLAGYLRQKTYGRPEITLKLATSLDGCIALADGTSHWITGPSARAHTHALRSRCDAILVGGGTLRADNPRLDVRLPGLEASSPERWVLSRSAAPAGWQRLSGVEEVGTMADIQHLLVEGGGETAAAFLKADLVDRVVLYRAPILIGGGRRSLGDVGLTSLAAAHGRWRQTAHLRLGSDTAEFYERTRCSPE